MLLLLEMPLLGQEPPFLPLFWEGYWLADSYWGRYRTVVIFATVFFIALVLLTLSASASVLQPPPCHADECPEASVLQYGVFFSVLYLIATAGGIMKASLSPFGADQFDDTDSEERKKKTSFFNWLYFSMHIGSLISSSIIVWIQDNMSWGWGFGILTIFMALAIAIFFSGTPLYRFQKPGGSPLSRVFQVIVASVHNYRKEIPEDAYMLYEVEDKHSAIQGSRKIKHTNDFSMKSGIGALRKCMTASTRKRLVQSREELPSSSSNPSHPPPQQDDEMHDDPEYEQEEDEEDDEDYNEERVGDDEEGDEEQPVSHAFGDGGPMDNSLLPFMTHHIARRLWDEPQVDRGVLKIIHHPDTLGKWSLANEPEQVGNMIIQAGIWRSYMHSYKFIDQVLVTAFVERWHAETNTFHMPFGEMTITLDDVEHLMGIPIVGTCLTGANGAHLQHSEAIKFLTDFLGISATEAMKELGGAYSVRLTWLREKFQSCPNNASTRHMHFVARAYLLHAIGCVVLPDKSGNRVPIYYLQSLLHLSRVGEQAWGMGILAFLYRQLGIATRSGIKQITGCMMLLLAWIYEHFDIRRPPMNINYRPSAPLSRRWATAQSSGDQKQALMLLRTTLDSLDADSVIWTPYDRQTRPISQYAWYSGLLVCYNVAEPHYPERVLRQYGRRQTIPRHPMRPLSATVGATGTYHISYDPQSWYQDNWDDHLLSDSLRSVPAVCQADIDPRYMQWFLTVSHPRITIGPPPPVELPRSCQIIMLRESMTTAARHPYAIRTYNVDHEIQEDDVFEAMRLMEELMVSTLQNDYRRVERRQKALGEHIKKFRD